MLSNSIWLFHFRIAGEKLSKSKENAHGIGHALRCLTLIDELESSYKIQPLIVINNTIDGQNFLKSKGKEFFYENDLESILKNHNVEIIISDINYLEDEYINIYEKFSAWVCLAPRGEAKFRSSIAFKETLFNDIEQPLRLNENKIYSGTEYMVTRQEYNIVRQKLSAGEIIKDPKKIIISMGGVDQSDLTSLVARHLSDFDLDWKIEIIVGPLYDNYEGLLGQVRDYRSNMSIVVNPDNIYSNIATSTIGIYAAGLISYESIGLGTPCININLSEFHNKRSKELETLGVSVNLGDMSSLLASRIKDTINDLSNDTVRLELMRKKGINLIDGKGSRRILSTINQFLDSA